MHVKPNKEKRGQTQSDNAVLQFWKKCVYHVVIASLILIKVYFFYRNNHSSNLSVPVEYEL